MFILITLIFWLLAVTVAITVHEFAHAWMADYLGDPTARLSGRLSLNPLSHYDRVGTTLLLVSVVMRAFGAPIIPIGWAKPVEFDPFNLKNPRRDSALIALAGPLTNILFAIALALLIRLPSFMITTAALPVIIVNLVLQPMIILNVVLALFNLIPVHPLDGGKILVGLLPKTAALEMEQVLRQYGLIILLLLILPIRGVSPVSYLLGPAVEFFLRLLLP